MSNDTTGIGLRRYSPDYVGEMYEESAAMIALFPKGPYYYDAAEADQALATLRDFILKHDGCPYSHPDAQERWHEERKAALTPTRSGE